MRFHRLRGVLSSLPFSLTHDGVPRTQKLRTPSAKSPELSKSVTFLIVPLVKIASKTNLSEKFCWPGVFVTKTLLQFGVHEKWKLKQKGHTTSYRRAGTTFRRTSFDVMSVSELDYSASRTVRDSAVLMVVVAFRFFFFLSADQLSYIISTFLKSRVSPQWLSELRRLRPRVFPDELHVSLFSLIHSHTMSGQPSQPSPTSLGQGCMRV